MKDKNRMFMRNNFTWLWKCNGVWRGGL